MTQKIGLKTWGSREEALAFIRDVCIPHPWHRSVCIDDYLIGFISVFPGSDVHSCRGEMGYAIAAMYLGQRDNRQGCEDSLISYHKSSRICLMWYEYRPLLQ